MSPDLSGQASEGHRGEGFQPGRRAKPVCVDVRILCATNKDLQEMIAQKTFRQDLYHRLSAFPIRVPPLRERREDIPRLAAKFVEHFRRELGRPELALPQAAGYLSGNRGPAMSGSS